MTEPKPTITTVDQLVIKKGSPDVPISTKQQHRRLLEKIRKLKQRRNSNKS